jgi:hypothetical protein
MLPIGLLGLLLSRKWLYRLFVFWTLFSASAAANFGEGQNASALQVWMLFGSLWLARLGLDHLLTFSFSGDRRILRPCLWLTAFLFISSLSLVMPVYINGKLAIASPFLFDVSETPLFLTSHNVTQLLYLIFGVLIAICVAHSNLRDEQRHETERIILISAIVLAVWGLIQFVCNVTGIPYPYYIFNNSGSISGGGYSQTFNGLGRITSGTLEASVFAQDLLSLLPLTLAAWLGRGFVLSVWLDRCSAVLFVAVLLLSTSSTAYVGLMALVLVLLPVLLRTGTISKARALKSALITGVTVFAVVALFASSNSVVRDVLTSAVVEKSSSGSALERLMTVQLAFGYFQRFPMLGIGWGSATSHDLIVLLLSNVGIIGACTFFGAMFCIMRANWRAMGPLVSSMDLSRSAWFLGLTMLLFTSIIGGFPLVLGNFWLVLGMAIATGLKTETRESPTSPQSQHASD